MKNKTHVRIWYCDACMAWKGIDEFDWKITRIWCINADSDIDAINDAIGDILVTLIVGASNDESIYEAVCEELVDDIYRETVISSTEDLRNAIPDLVSSSFRLIRRKNKPSQFNYLDCIRDLNRIRTRMNEEFDFVCSINHCLELAYNEIKDRTGRTDENGHFIKDN